MAGRHIELGVKGIANRLGAAYEQLGGWLVEFGASPAPSWRMTIQAPPGL